MAWFNSLKDTAVAGTVRTFLNSQIKDFGKIAHLDMDTAKRQIAFKVELEGEITPVEVTLTGYQISETGGKTVISAPDGAFTASRPWLTKLLNAQVAGRTFDVPEKFASYAKALA